MLNKFSKINFDSYVKFRPTIKAAEIYYEEMKRVYGDTRPPKLVQHDNVATMHLWRFMALYGEHIKTIKELSDLFIGEELEIEIRS